MNKLRKSLVIGVMAITVLATMGMYAPVKASASAGDLIKMDGLASVYYLGSDGKRYVFPNSPTFFSWYTDFSGVVTIPASELQSYPLGGNVVMRSGTKLVKITTDPKVYAVEPNGVLRGIGSEAQALALYGTNWNKMIVDVPDAFFTNYTIGTALADGATPAGALVKNAGSSNVYYYDGTNYRLIANEAAMSANRFNMSNVLTLSNTITAGGSSITNAEFVNVAQGGGVGPIITGSGLMVSLNANTPAAASVPSNGARIPMAKVNLTAANDGAVTVNSITVKRIGLSEYTYVDKVWAEKDGVTVASKKTMNSNNESVLTFSPALTINAGQTVALDLLFSLKNNGSGNMAVSIATASAVSSTGATVSGSFPVNGNLMSLTSYNVTEVALDNGITSNTDVNVGDENVQLGKFDILFHAYSKDIALKTVMFKNSGDEDMAKTLMNVYLENNGKKVADGVISGKYITFTFSNGGLTMLKDDSDQTFTIKGDVIAKENTNATGNILLTFNKLEDLNGNELSNGFGVQVVDVLNEYVSKLNIKSSAVAVSKKTTSPSDTTIIKGAKGNVALLANVKADEAITADGLKINVEELNVDAFENVKVFVNGVLLDSFDPTATGYHDFDSTLSLNKGDNEVKVTVDAKSVGTSTTATFKVSLNKPTFALLIAPEYVLSGNAVSADSITGSATGAVITVAGADLSAIRSDGYGTKNIVKGSSDVSLGKFTVKATNDTVKITQIAVTASSTQTVLAANIYDMKIFIDGTQVGTTRDFTSTGATFSSLNISVADNATKIIELKGSFDTSASGTVRMVNTFTAEDSRGKTIYGIETPETTAFTMVSTGSLGIAKDGDSPIGSILVSKSTEQPVAIYKLTATNDSANVTELTVVNASSTATSTTITTTDPRISAYKLYVEGNSTAIDTVTPFQGSAKFVINNNSIIVPADGSKKITIKAVLNNIDNDASQTDAYLMLQVNSVKYKSSNGDLTYDQGLSSQAEVFRIRKTAPTVVLVTLPNTTLTSGDQVVAKFTVAADANADVKLSRIALRYATSSANVGIATSTNALKVNGVTKTTNVTSSINETDKNIFVDFGTSTPEVISAGTTKTFEVLVNVTLTGNTRESLGTSLKESAYSDATGKFLSWTDSASNTDALNVWFNSWRVNGLSTDTQTLTVN